MRDWWCGAALILAGCDQLFQLTEVPDPRSDSQVQYSRAITVTPSTPGSLIDFPLSIVIDQDAHLAATARTDGLDIGFTTTDGAPLAFEIVEYDAGSLEAWVQVTLTGVTELRMIYGGPPIDPDPRAAWSNAFIAAWHLDPASPGRDSTRRDLGLSTPVGRADSLPVGGVIGGGRAFVDSATLVQRSALCGRPADRIALGTRPFSFSVWMNADGTQLSTFDQPFHAGGNTNGTAGFCFETESANLSAQLADDGTLYEQVNFAAAPRMQWVHLVAVYSPPSTIRLYLDGLLSRERTTLTLGAITTEPPVCLGGPEGFSGMVDEPRVYDMALSPEWVDAEYDNVKSRDDFVRIAPIE